MTAGKLAEVDEQLCNHWAVYGMRNSCLGGSFNGPVQLGHWDIHAVLDQRNVDSGACGPWGLGLKHAAHDITRQMASDFQLGNEARLSHQGITRCIQHMSGMDSTPDLGQRGIRRSCHSGAQRIPTASRASHCLHRCRFRPNSARTINPY